MNRNRRNKWTRRSPQRDKLVVRNIHPGRMDVHLSDLGYKVPFGQTRDLLAPETGLDPARVRKSLLDGSLKLRLDQRVLVRISQSPKVEIPRKTVAEPHAVSFPQRFKSFALPKVTDLSDQVAEAIIDDDDDFLKEMDEDGMTDGPPLVAPSPAKKEE